MSALDRAEPGYQAVDRRADRAPRETPPTPGARPPAHHAPRAADTSGAPAADAALATHAAQGADPEDAPGEAAFEPMATSGETTRPPLDLVSFEGPPPPPKRSIAALPRSRRAASVRLLRERIVSLGDPRVTLIVSASMGEGKTTCAVDLAAAFGDLDDGRVLLVDGNPARPHLARALGVTPPTCLASQLAARAHGAAPSWRVGVHEALGVHVLAVDPASPDPLDPVALVAALGELRHRYARTIIDGPAVLEGADANLLQRAADGVVFVARSGLTLAPDLVAAVRQLAPTPLLGVALLD